MSASVAHFVTLEVRNLIEMLIGIGFLATGWPGAIIAVLRMETVIYVAMKFGRAMKPWARAKENAAGKPLRTVVAVGSAVVGRDVIVSVRTDGRNSNLNGYLSLGFRSSYCEAECDDNG